MSKLLGFLKNSSSRPASELEAALSEATLGLDKARQTLATAQGAYENSRLADDPKASLTVKDKVIGAEVLLDRAQSVVELAQTRLGEARAKAAEADRVSRYRAALEASSTAQTVLEGYPALAKKIVGILKTVAQAEAAVAAANADLPTDMRPLIGPEQAIRSLPTDRREVVSEKSRPLWCYAFTGQAVEPEYLNLIQSEDGRTGTFRVTRFGEGARDFRVIKRREVRTEYLQDRGGYIPEPLSTRINLPALRPGEADIWQPAGTPLIVSGHLGAGTEMLLGRIDEVEASWRRPASDPRQPRQEAVQVSIEDLSGAEPVEVAA